MRGTSLMVLGLLGCVAEPAPAPPALPTECLVTVGLEEIDFGEVETGVGTQSRQFVLHNSAATAQVLVIDPLRAPFAVHPEQGLVMAGRSDTLISVDFDPQDGLLHLETLSIRSHDGLCVFQIPVRALGRGEIRAVPDALLFELNPGQEQTQELRIENSRREPVLVELQWLAGTGFGPFTFEAPLGLTVPALGSVPVLVKAAPITWNGASSRLNMRVGSQGVNVAITQRPASPRPEFTPASIELPRAALGLLVERTIRVRNAGASGEVAAPPLRFDGVVQFGESLAELSVELPTVTLAEGESTELKVRLRPSSAGQRDFTFFVHTNREIFSPTRFAVTTLVEQPSPCSLEHTPPSVLQLQDALDGGVEGSVTFTNTSVGAPCVVDDLRLSSQTSPAYSIVGGAQQVAVASMSSHRVTIAGPRPVDGGVVGAFGFHVLQPDRVQEWIELRADAQP